VSFINPILLWGLLFMLLPPIVWLLTRRKWRVLDWGAMDILLEIVAEQHKRRKLWEIILWILRVLLLALVALALARPLLGGGSFFGGGGRMLILIDNSLSMATRAGASSRFDKAKERALELVGQAGVGTGIALVTLNEQAEPVIGHFSADHPLVTETIKGMSVSDLGGNIDAGLRAGLEVIQQFGGGCTSYVISDFQRSEWADAKAERVNLLRQLQDLGGVTMLAIADGLAGNCSATGLRVAAGAARAGSPVPLVATLFNHGSKAVDLTAELLIDQDVADSSRVSVPAGGSVETMLHTSALSAGLHRISVRLPHDHLLADNTFHLALSVVDAVPVLAVVADDVPADGTTPASFIELCLNPYLDGSEAAEAAFDVTTINASDLLGEDLSAYQLLVVAQLPGINALQAEHLEGFVASGGGLMLFFGKRCDPDNWNNLLHRGGEGLLARPLETSLLREDDDQLPLQFKPESPGHPLWQGLVGGSTDYFSQAAIWSSWSFAPADDRNVSLASASRQDQAEAATIAYDVAHGRGHALIFGTSADLSMNNLAIRKVYVGMINQAVAHLRSFAGGQRQVRTGESLERGVDFARSQASYRLTSPDSSLRVVSVRSLDGDYRLELPPLNLAGFYLLINKTQSDDRDLLAANAPALEEGAIGSLDGNALAERYQESGADIGSELGNGGVVGAEIAGLLLILTLMCWAGENIISHRITVA